RRLRPAAGRGLRAVPAPDGRGHRGSGRDRDRRSGAASGGRGRRRVRPRPRGRPRLHRVSIRHRRAPPLRQPAGPGRRSGFQGPNRQLQEVDSPMKSPAFALVLVALTAAGTTAIVLPAATAQSQDQASSTVSSQPSAPLVTGLPDFTRLVDRVAPAVVNIEVVVGLRGNRQAQQLPDDMPEFFRRFFGPGTPFPGVPQDPGGRSARSMGSGFLISADGYVRTNHHGPDGAPEATVTLPARRALTAAAVGRAAQSDVAVLKIDARDLPLLRAGNADGVKPGQWAIAIGSPFGFDQSVTAGIVSAVGRANHYSSQRYVPFIQTDVAINRGNS